MTDDRIVSDRREFMRRIGRYSMAACLGAVGVAVARRSAFCSSGPMCDGCPERSGCGSARKRRVRDDGMVWQLDPEKCVQCGRCATDCVLALSAVKCVHATSMCGYCKMCFGYFQPRADKLNENAENQLCPTGAIERSFVEDPYYEYTIVEELCIGCGKCVEGCGAFGNGSLHLQVRHDRCLDCNDCAIARNCPADAFSRVPVSAPYRLKGGESAV